MRFNQLQLEKVRIEYNLDSLRTLDLTEDGYPENFKDYVKLSFRYKKGTGRHGIIWSLPDSTHEMIIDNNVAQLIGEVWYYKLSEDFKQLLESMLLMR